MFTCKCLARGIGGVMINPKFGAIWSSWISNLRKWGVLQDSMAVNKRIFFHRTHHGCLRSIPVLFWKMKQDGITFLLFSHLLAYMYSTKFVFFYFLGRFCFNNDGFRHHLRKHIKP